MHVNFRFGSTRRCLRVVNGECAIDTWDSSTLVWIGYRPISKALAMRFMALHSFRAAVVGLTDDPASH